MPQPNMLSMLMTRMDWLSQNQAVIATNISKMGIPGAKAHKLEDLDFKKRLGDAKVVQAKTQPGHMTGGAAEGRSSATDYARDYKISITGNDIHYRDQLRQANEAAAYHQQMASLYGRFSNIFRLGMKS